MTLYDLKPQFQALLRPWVAKLYHASVTANQITVTAMLLSLLLGGILSWCAVPGAFFVLSLFLFIRMALNAMDGMLAREYQQQSRLGAILNELGDVVSDAALYLPFAFLPAANPWLVILVVMLAMLSEFCGVLGLAIGQSRRYDGPLGKSDRALLLGGYALAITIWPSLLAWSWLVFLSAALLLVWTCFNRCRGILAGTGK